MTDIACFQKDNHNTYQPDIVNQNIGLYLYSVFIIMSIFIKMLFELQKYAFLSVHWAVAEKENNLH